MKVKSLSRVRLFTIPWIAAYQAPPSMGFSRQKYWSGVPLPSPIAKQATFFFLRFSLWWLLLLGSLDFRDHGLQSVGSGVEALGLQSTGSVVVGHQLRCFAAFGIFSDQGSNSCHLHWQVGSLLLSQQGSPILCFLIPSSSLSVCRSSCPGMAGMLFSLL